MNLKRAFKNEPSDNSIVLICVLRDEILLLPYFIEYYTKMGVSHFIFVDNDSIDDSQKYLCEHPFENIKVYHINMIRISQLSLFNSNCLLMNFFEFI